MRRSSLASAGGDFGQWGKAVTVLSTSVLSWTRSSVEVPDQLAQTGSEWLKNCPAEVRSLAVSDWDENICVE